jgi:signal-transduction protein with cAMP-binding, CBS, and nucleotidyltransferase domain
MDSTLISFFSRFDKVTEELSDIIQEFSVQLTLPKKSLLLKSGEICNHLYFIKKGVARNFVNDGNKELTTDLSMDSELVSSFSSFITRNPSIECIELLEDAILDAISYDNLQMLYRKYPSFNKTGRLITEYYYHHLTLQTNQLRFSTTTERYLQMMERKPQLIQRVPLKYVASYLGMTLENLSRVRKNMQNMATKQGNDTYSSL